MHTKNYHVIVDLLLKNIFDFHKQLQAEVGVRDEGLIESAINAPFQTFGGQDLYPTIFDKATQLGYGLTKNHGFVDGNKRVALHATEIFLMLHDFILTSSQTDRVKIFLEIAGGKLSPMQFKSWLQKKSTRQKKFNHNAITLND